MHFSHHSLDWAFVDSTAPFACIDLISSVEYPIACNISIVFSPISGSGSDIWGMAGVLDKVGAGTWNIKLLLAQNYTIYQKQVTTF